MHTTKHSSSARTHLLRRLDLLRRHLQHERQQFLQLGLDRGEHLQGGEVGVELPEHALVDLRMQARAREVSYGVWVWGG
jgi:hypothetical protein